MLQRTRYLLSKCTEHGSLPFLVLMLKWLYRRSRTLLRSIGVDMMIQADVAAEAGVGRDEATLLSTRGHRSCLKPCWLRWLDGSVLYTTMYLFNNNGESRRALGRIK